MKKRILVVEDDAHLADGLQINLSLEGYEPILAGSAGEGFDIWSQGGIDLILLDVMLPDQNGFEFCRRIRQSGDRVPVLFLTARGSDVDRIRGLEEGGDDYLVKPFNLRELLVRVKGIFRRQDWLQEKPAPELLCLGENRINLRSYTVANQRGRHSLKEKEVLILQLLAERWPAAVDRKTILDRVWGFGAFPTTRTVDNFILSLRKVLEEDPAHPEHILTVHGVGYRLGQIGSPGQKNDPP
jgi:two-component system alkaline phosphatase synthesis response regulator PhoP